MSVASDYYDDGGYYYIVLGKECCVEILVYTVKHQKTRLAEDKASLSKKGKELLKSASGSKKMKFIRETNGDMWLRVGEKKPDLSSYDRAVLVPHTVKYYRIVKAQCKKDHKHSSKCVTIDWPYMERKAKEEKSVKEEKSQKSTKRSS